MDSASTKIRMATLPKRHSHRLLFDRRYGWVFDEWKDPSEEALAGGRGMFCILPLAKAFLTTASQSIDKTANFAVKVLDSPDLLSSQALQTSLRNQLNKFKSSIKKAESNRFALEEHSLQAPTSPPHLLSENEKSQIN
ncbi:HEAT repeat-containing protein [Salix suchowensis]|nr:HEAT repeat-containing protein [Salix suchowensis]